MTHERELEETPPGEPYERLVEAGGEGLPDEARARVFARVQADIARPAHRASGAAAPRPRHGLDWFVGGLIAAAAAAVFAFSLNLTGAGAMRPDGTGTPAGGEEARIPATELLAKLKAEDFEVRRAAFAALLAGGEAARKAVEAFTSQGDAEQDRAVQRLKDAFALAARLPAAYAPQDLAFWRALWEREAEEQPTIWSLGLKLHPETPQPSAPPSTRLGDALVARHGAARAAEARAGFARAYEALRAFQSWERAGPVTDGEEAEHAARARRFDALLQAVAEAGPAAAPVVLNVLERSPAQMIRSEHPPGSADPYPLDHLRMMVAAVKLKLREAAPILARKYARGYPTSGTIQAHAVQAIWLLEGRPEKVPAFPFDFGEAEQVDVEGAIACCVKRRVGELAPCLGDEDFRARQEAEDELLALGADALAPLKALPPPEDPEARMRIARIVERLDSGLPFVKTLDEAVALRRKYVAAATDPQRIGDAGHVRKQIDLALKALERARELAPDETRDLLAADLLYESGMAHYKLSRPAGGREGVLKRAALDLSMAVDLYAKYLKDHPADKAVEARQTEANMILYASEKYQTIEAPKER
ncbi:MAG: hypothetical protein M5U26_02910 [Planctomycetota bacterium]|nr:hypothetical protein [Planctomycetota bacterium]